MLKKVAIFIVLAAFGWLSAGPRPAEAHAIVVTASPKAESVVAGPDVAIELHFNSRLDRERSRLTLTLPDGTSRKVDIDPTGAPEVLAAQASGLAPGKYVLKWQVLAVDGHITRGEIPFSIGE